MDYSKLAKTLEGLQTVESIAKIINVNKRTAINYIYELRKLGLAETFYGKRKIRMYKIRSIKKPETGYPGLYETINKYSKVKIIPSQEHRIHDYELTVEEAIVRAIKSGSFRLVLASLGLFAKVENWSLLNKLAKKERITRKIGALYDIARTTIRVRKMDKRTRASLLKGKVKSKYIINRLRSKQFLDIEKLWRVYVPFNRADLEVYKE